MASTNFVRQLVSKKKRRFEWGQYDLDLSYITSQIIAMAYPAENFEALYRNRASDVKSFLDTVHPGRYLVVNLCTERKYPASKFEERVLEFPFDDHTAPPFKLIHEFCTSVEKWLDDNGLGVAAIHCKAGKGRTGTMVCCFLLYSGYCRTANEAERFFGNKRTKNGQGVTIPSQKRYIKYYERALNDPRFDPMTIYSAPRPVLTLKKVTMYSLPSFGIGGGCEPCMGVSVFSQSGTRTLFFAKASKVDKDKGTAVFESNKFPIFQDVNFLFFHKSSKTKMCSVSMNMMFVADEFVAKPEKAYTIELKKRDIDKAAKDKDNKHFTNDFRLKFEFGVMNSSFSKAPVNAAYGVSAEEMKRRASDAAAKKVEAEAGGASVSDETICSGCSKAIYQSDMALMIGDDHFHWACARCSVCSEAMGDVHDVVQGEQPGSMICSRCVVSGKEGVPEFVADFMHHCEICKMAIKTDYYQSFAGALYHDECFGCAVCDRSLIGVDAPDKLGQGRLKCQECPVPQDPTTSHQDPLHDVRQAARLVQNECDTVEDILSRDGRPKVVRGALRDASRSLDVCKHEADQAASRDLGSSAKHASAVADQLLTVKVPLAVTADRLVANMEHAATVPDHLKAPADDAVSKAKGTLSKILGLARKQAQVILESSEEELASSARMTKDFDGAVMALAAEADALPLAEDAAAAVEEAAKLDDEAPQCAGCGKPVAVDNDTSVFVVGQTWHVACMKCHECSTPFDGDRYVIVGDTLVCPKCDRQRLVKDQVCGHCSEKISGGYTELDDGMRFHSQCFVCTGCSVPLGGKTYGELAGDVYCEACLEGFLPRCAKCRKAVGDVRLKALGKVFHRTCFTCTACDKQLGAEFFPVDGAAYCEPCANAI